MNFQNNLRLEEIELHNFRCFESCKLSLHENLTVLVAENGRGKTAILEAISIALASVVHAISGIRPMRLSLADTRMNWDSEKAEMRPHLPVGFTARGYFSGENVTWKSESNRYDRKSRSSTKDLKQLKKIGAQYKEHNHEAPIILPLIAFYGTGRLWSQSSKRTRISSFSNRFSGYTDCLSSSSSFKGMQSWYEERWNALRDSRFSAQITENTALLLGVKQATKVVLAPTGWGNLDWYKSTLILENEDEVRLPIHALSDGIRTMTALAADIARRCATLNPHLGEDAARETPGILLVDEIDMHLHPRWQQKVVGLLQEAFPSLQIILSTHSPQVLSAVNNDSIRVLSVQDSNGIIETPYSQTRGVRSADVLAKIMDVDPIPEVPEASYLSDYQALIEDGKSTEPEALALRKKLIAHFGETHPVILECDRLKRFQDFKIKKEKGSEQ